MKNLQRRSALLLISLHPSSFRQRFAAEMLLDCEDLCQSHGCFWLFLDLLSSIIRQWGLLFQAWIWPKPAVSRSAFLAGHSALVFQAPLTPYEISRGFAFSVLLFTAFWSLEDPASRPGDFLRLLYSAASPAGVSKVAPSGSSHQYLEIRNVTIVDVEHGALLFHQTVYVEDGMVTAVSPAQRASIAKPGVDVLDGGGKFLIPGLWDMHTHITHPDVDFPLYIANGVLGI